MYRNTPDGGADITCVPERKVEREYEFIKEEVPRSKQLMSEHVIYVSVCNLHNDTSKILVQPMGMPTASTVVTERILLQALLAVQLSAWMVSTSGTLLILCRWRYQSIYSEYSTLSGSKIYDQANIIVIYVTIYSDQILPPANDQHCQRGLDSSSHLNAA